MLVSNMARLDRRFVAKPLQFNDHLLQAAGDGGRMAAIRLLDAVKNHIAQTRPDLPSDVEIVAKVYANLKGLAEAAYRKGIIDRPIVIEEFFRGMTCAHPLFDFIDVGSGKDRSFVKLAGMLHLSNIPSFQIAQAVR